MNTNSFHMYKYYNDRPFRPKKKIRMDEIDNVVLQSCVMKNTEKENI